MRVRHILPVALVLGLSLAVARPCRAAAADRRLDRAVLDLRGISPSASAEARQRAVGSRIEPAWRAIEAAGPQGAERLKREIEKIDAQGDTDDVFKLTATALLWRLGGLEEADYVAGVWEHTPLDANFDYVFLTAIEAAKTHDERILPMLTACLRDTKGHVSLQENGLDLDWARTHEYVWAVYGPSGFPVLAKLLETSSDQSVLSSALFVVARAQHLDALPAVRRLARDGPADARMVAVQCLGIYGHPDDFDFLASGLESKNREVVWTHAYALFEFQDLRVVPLLASLLKSPDLAIRQEAMACLIHLVTPEALKALEDHSENAPTREEQDRAIDAVNTALQALGLKWDEFAAKTPEEQQALVEGLRTTARKRYELGAEDRPATREDFLAAVEDWRMQGTMAGGRYGWMQPRHILSVATAEDVPLLLEVKGAICRRLTREGVREVDVLDDLIRRLGRSRYRKDAWISPQVERLRP